MPTHRRLLQALSSIVILTMLFSGVSSPSASAQGGDGVERQVNAQTGKVSFLGGEGGGPLPASRVLGIGAARPQDPAMALATRFGPEFGLKDPERNLSEMKSSQGNDGRLTVRYQQNYQGIPVMGGELIVNTNRNGDLYSMNGEVSANLSLSVQPDIEAAQAKQTALAAMAKWYQKAPENFLASEPELWIYDESLLRPSTRPAELVWRMEMTPNDAGMPVRELVLVDAHRGHISLHFNQIDMAWSMHGSSGAVQEPELTATPLPTELPFPTETTEPEAISAPTEQSALSEDSPSPEASASQVNALVGRTWYVAPTGNDSNSCIMIDAPCATINGAIAKATINDTIKVASGMYTNATGSVVTIDEGLTVSGGWDSTFAIQNGASIIDGGGVQNGIYINANWADVVIDHFVVQNSHANTDGGGVYLSGAKLILKNSSIVSNNAGRGAGIFVNWTPGLTILNSTVSHNSSSSSGGGIYAYGQVYINNSTIAYNHSSGTGGGISKSTYVNLRNSILARNTALGGGPDCDSNLELSDHSMIGNTTGCTPSSGTGNKLDVEPMLDSSLSGILPFHSLQAGSPAIHAGDNTSCLTTDQRAMPRPLGNACDMGAYEFPDLFVSSGFGQQAVTGTQFVLPFTVYVFDHSSNPVSGVTAIFTAPASGASGMFTDTGTRTSTAITNSDGQASSSSFIANNIVGPYSVHVSAVVAGYTESADIGLVNNGVLFVSTTGSDSNTCRMSGSPCLTINGALNKAIAGDIIRVAEGTYTGSGSEVVLINKSINISGGWNASFTSQTGRSIIDGQEARGGIFVNSAPDVVIDGFIIGNGGVGIRNSLSTLTLNNSVVTSNIGGGIDNYGTVTLNNTLVTDNIAGNSGSSGGGGGAGIESRGTLTLNNSTVSGNTLRGGFSGSGISAYGTLILNNSTVTGNTGGYGEGIHAWFANTTLNNSTISGNQSYGIRVLDGTLTMQNTIIAGNGSAGDCRNDDTNGGTFISQGFNLIGNVSGCPFTPTTGDLVNVNAKLGTLIGFPGYIPLLAGSPAIDAGNPSTPGSSNHACLMSDQRGVTRPVGARCDMGAYEYSVPGNVARLFIASGDGQHTGPNLTFSRPLVVAALDSLGSPVSGISITFAAPASGASGTFADTHTRTTTSVTNADGIATASAFTANSLRGVYTLTAAASGVSTIHFNLQNFAWFVATSGSDSNSCSAPNSPCATIDGALGKASNGDTLEVAIGTFTSSVYEGVAISRKSITLSGGWNETFTRQSGLSTIDGQGVRSGISSSSDASVIIDRFVIRNTVGAGVYNHDSVLILSNSVVTDNQTVGILNHGTMTVHNTTISNNTGGDPCCVGGGGGAGIDHRSGTLTLNNSLISNNTLLGGFSGSGIYVGVGTLILNNSTVSGNTGGDGTGITTFGGNIILNNSTISFNQTYGVKNTAGNVIVRNSILAGNGSGRDCYRDSSYSGALTSQGYNLIGNGTRCSFTATAGDLVGTDANPIDPRLAPLQNYGGLTSTHALMAGSPAIGSGNPAAPGTGSNACLSTDQRGIPRPQEGRCDMGAFEYSGPGTTPTYSFAYAGTPQTVYKGRINSVGLKVLVVDENGNGFPGITVTYTAPVAGASVKFTNTNTNMATVVTDMNGMATSPTFQANNILGTYIIAATVTGIAGSANFEITNAIIPIRTYTANHSYLLPGTLLCQDTESSCTNGQNPRADKAHAYALGMANLYLTKHQRAGIDQNNMPIISTVEYCGPFSGCPYRNAFWNGEQLVYGDGYGYALADDVVAHEFTHGVTQYESSLFPYYQSGAINESFSDLWGEYYDQTNGQGNDTPAVKWQVGEDVSGQGVLRSMSYPPTYNDPDKMSSPLYYEGAEDNGGIHTNSGVNNKAVYLMVDGGTFNGKTVTALGWDRTAAIYYEANTNLLLSGSDYSDLYYALQRACSNLIGQRGITAANCTEVKDAIDAVEMNGQPALNFNTHAPYCSSGVPIISFADDLEIGVGNWTFTNGNQPQRWQWDSPYGPYAQSGLHSLYADDYPDVISDSTARLKPIVVPNNAYIHFAQAYEFETGYRPWDPTLSNFDGGVLEYSINNGVTWTDAGSLMDFNGYRGTIYAGWNNPLKGRRAFVGSSHGYISTRLNLASLAGKTVTFRWRMGLDGAYYAWGWWVDNIKVYTCGMAPPATFNKTTPSSGATNQSTSLTFSWGASTGTTSYQYCYDTTNDGACSNWTSNGASRSKVISGLSMGTTYYWHVRAINSGGTTYSNGSPTAFWSFTTLAPPGTFNKTSPSNNATGVGLSTTLSWSSSSSVNYYQYCYDTIDDNQCNRNWSGPVTTTSATISNLGPNTTYYWQVRAVNAVATQDADNESWGSFTTTSTLLPGTAAIKTFISTTNYGAYSLGSGQSLRESYGSVSNGPVKIQSTNNIPLIAAERVIYKVNNISTSFSEMMGLPGNQLDTIYWLPWYNNVGLDTQLRFANVSNSTATVQLFIGGVEKTTGCTPSSSPYTLAVGASLRVSCAGVDNGPVEIRSTQNIVAAERVIYKVNGLQTSFSEMMALPNQQLDTTYWLPWYNNVGLDTQLRFANVSNSAATVQLFIGGVEKTTGCTPSSSPFTLGIGESLRVSCADVDSGPVEIRSDVNIVAAERVIYKVNNVYTSFSEMMALPDNQLDTTFWFPWYNNVDLDTQLRFANVTDTPATINIYVGGAQVGDPISLAAGESTRVSFPSISNGPVQIVSDVPIVASERVIYKVNNVYTSFSEMMGLPDKLLDPTYWLPWYNNIDLDTQLRFAVP